MTKLTFGIAIATTTVLAGCGGTDADSEQTITTEDGEEITIDHDGTGGMTINTEDGSATITSGTSDGGAAGEMPAYPNARTAGGYSVNANDENGGGGQMSTFQTDDTPEQVIAFYRNALESQGYRVTATMQTGQHQAISAEGNANNGVQVTATSMGGAGTNVAVVVAQGG